jgi:hypothetical protein
MSDYNPRHYREYKFEKEGSMLENYYVTVSALSGKPVVGNKKKYKTPAYKSTTEAFTHAYGWVDCMLPNKTDPDEPEDSWKKAYDELRKYQAEFYHFPLISKEEKLEPHQEEKDEAWEEKLKQAYKKGWMEKKLIDGDN